ncbi:MAG TPA: amidase [Bacilli bacterium]|nr:amidase [Bacilli bacterium]
MTVEVKLHQKSATELAHAIRQREVTSTEVVAAFIARIQEVNPSQHALVVERFAEARQAAEELDRLAARGEFVGPLHGVPVTVKENLDVQGLPSTWGLEHRRKHVAQADDPVWVRLQQAGAILLGKTNAMQVLMGCETVNPVYGRTTNPWDASRTPGGSTGGEGSLIAAGGSPLGIGTDIGGSIRTPAHFCGIHGFKPTPGTVVTRPSSGIRHVRPEAGAMSSAGPLARTVADLRLAYRVLTEAALDDKPASLTALRVGFYMDDGILSPSPAIRRAVREAAEALQQRGFEVVPYTPPHLREAMQTFYGILCADGGAGLQATLADTTVEPQIRKLLQSQGLKPVARKLLTTLLRLAGQRIVTDMALPYVGRKSEAAWNALLEKRDAVRHAILQDIQSHGIDLLLCPTFPVVALPHDTSLDLSFEGSFNSVYNLLGCPSGVVSITRVRAGEESDRNPLAKDKVEQAALRTETGSVGLPVGVQVVGLPGQDEEVLALMAAVEESFQARADYPPAQLLTKGLFQPALS